MRRVLDIGLISFSNVLKKFDMLTSKLLTLLTNNSV